LDGGARSASVLYIPFQPSLREDRQTVPPVLDIVPPDLAAHAPQTGAPHPHGCPSCHFPAQGNFCSHCGESTHPHPPSAGEFLHEFVGHYVALEGKLWRTLRTLLLPRDG
jgi:hypothetical protein